MDFPPPRDRGLTPQDANTHTPAPETLLKEGICKCSSGILCMDLPRISEYLLVLFKA